MRKSLSGFTIVELLIVIVVIAILAAISVVAFNGIQQRARASAASTGVSQSKKKLEYYKVENGSYPTTGNLSAAGITNTDTTYQYTSDGTTFCVTGTNGTVSYKVTDTTAPSAGGCAGHGQGGQAAITNLANYGSATVYQPGNNNFGFRNDRWTGDGTYSLLAGVTTPVPTLTTAIRYTWTTTSGSNRGYSIGQNPDALTTTAGVAVTPGTTYVVSLYGRASLAATQYTGNIGCRFWDASGASLGSVSSVAGPTLTSSWQRYSHTLTAPASAATMGCRFVLPASTVTVGDTLDATGLMLTQGSTLYNYANGASTDWTWNGTAHASTSTGPAL